MIVSLSMYSPEYFHKYRPETVLPDIRRWSDVAFIEYRYQCGWDQRAIRKIKYFLIHGVQSQYWKNMVRDKYYDKRDKAWKFPLWENSRMISMESTLGKKLLASPVGRGPVNYPLHLASHSRCANKPTYLGLVSYLSPFPVGKERDHRYSHL